MAWYVVCDKCGVMGGGTRHPDLPEEWLQLRSGRLYCNKPKCANAGQRAWRRQTPKLSPAERAMQAIYHGDVDGDCALA